MKIRAGAFVPVKKLSNHHSTMMKNSNGKKFANWVRTNFRKEETMKILFSDEKYFDIDRVYNSQNDQT